MYSKNTKLEFEGFLESFSFKINVHTGGWNEFTFVDYQGRHFYKIINKFRSIPNLGVKDLDMRLEIIVNESNGMGGRDD